MKRIATLAFAIILVLSCSNDDIYAESDIVGTWKLIQIKADPGDGSAEFRSVKSEKTIQFKSNGTVSTNTSLCDPYSEEIRTAGKFDLENLTITTNCENPNIATISFEWQDETLVLNFISNEGYSQKFQKID
ncbi:lipocalin family protein [Flagellimonas algicola]|uniref:Lipocalin-like domain-containing protein n=1 Tax=Flagellimonas algicola TaxID=2583815 RepID=A0ABY2WNP1_9FLAO|nr:lipocalin family protein [Allomuricauda algicola]TMU56611.1 hypothetical protein FGG15_03465 [Allomuricauda algicola]